MATHPSEARASDDLQARAREVAASAPPLPAEAVLLLEKCGFRRARRNGKGARR